MNIVLYTRDDDASRRMETYLSDLGMEFRRASVDRDPAARKEWEALGGQITPVVVVDRDEVVRGMDRTRVDQILGLVGC